MATTTTPRRAARPVRKDTGPPPHSPSTTRRRRRAVALLYVLPALLPYTLFAVLPALHTAYLSLFDWDGVTLPSFIGLDNYRRVATDPQLRAAAWHAGALIVFFSVLPIAIGLVSAALVARRSGRRGTSLIRTLLFLPQVVPLVAVAVIWRWVYAENGTLNQALRAIGLGRLTDSWLGSFTWALPAVGLVGTWVVAGLCMVLFLSGTQRIDQEIYEAARMDGAGPVREFWSITVPLLRPEMAVALSITVIAALSSFDLIYITTGGGPGNSTVVPGILIYRLAFGGGAVGLASALAVVLTLVISVAVVLINHLARERS
ncbi:carbohydrate ABC transporter permease [Streptomyces coeruleorubidus]|uniref:Sugar ABC transporter permease n=1 Tax=Streptomyces coeruleorubidus TaxID=116188 RepID=A0A5J6HWP5_STRC4|nr:sugar ABC transporter permease [Streptomyces coeruleorubidus]QEV22771.1 sugar ABC transporter permease [Streptomyces coeruleorubidus]